MHICVQSLLHPPLTRVTKAVHARFSLPSLLLSRAIPPFPSLQQLSPLNYLPSTISPSPLPLQPPATAGKFRKWLWRTSNKKFLGIFVRHWIQISSLLVIYYVLLSLVYWGFLHAATEVRQNQWLSITNQSFFSPDGDFQMYLAQVRIISPIIL